ncbi:MAG: ADP-ribosylglycohydrolase family protein [Planctomycetota bacterium]
MVKLFYGQPQKTLMNIPQVTAKLNLQEDIMFVIELYFVTVLMCLLTMLCRRSWAENRKFFIVVIITATTLCPASAKGQPTESPGSVTLTKQVLLDKIRGGWVGKAYGVSFGGPTEFEHQGKIIVGRLELDTEGLRGLPGQDDMYVNMALLKTIVDHGLNASASDFAQDFAYGGFLLWHANGQGRQNILEGIPPEKSGHPLYNPHADDIDFQIECDFIGLICPGLPQAAQIICNRAGHLMNYGDGVYGGYFVTAMYASAFIEDDARQIVKAGLNALPADSGYAQIIHDVVNWHKEYPNDFKATWYEVEKKYNHDLCPWGVKRKFNIQARLNGAYIAMGMLYGDGNLKKTVEISTRCGQDSDCNPGNAGGIIGTMLGFENLPEKIKRSMSRHMNTDFHFTPFSIESASKKCAQLAIENVVANGGNISGDNIQIKVQPFKADGPAEVSFPSLEPVDMFVVTDERIIWKGQWKLFPKGDESMRRTSQPEDFMEVNFTGNVIYVQGDLRYDQGILEILVDGKSMGTRDMYLPKKWERADQSTAVWLTGLTDQQHKLQVRVTGKKNEKSEGIMVSLGKIVTYRGRVAGEK